MVMVGRHSWCRCPGWHEGDTCGIDSTVLYRRIRPRWCWLQLWFAGQVPILVEVVNCVLASCVYVFLDLPFCFFFCLRYDSYGAPLGLAPTWLSFGPLKDEARYPACMSSYILSFRARQSSVLWPISWWYLLNLAVSDPDLGSFLEGSLMGTSKLKASLRIIVRLAIKDA